MAAGAGERPSSLPPTVAGRELFTAVVSPALSETREFLARAFAWPQERDTEPSFINVHRVMRLTNEDGTPKMGKDGKQEIAMPGRATRNVDEAARAIEWANSLQTDVYMCMSAQREAEQKLSKRNFPYLKAVRKQTNVLRHKSFFIDVDVKPDDLAHGYATQAEAIQEFIRIRDALGLPRQTFIVLSGSGGFHAHWCLFEPILPDRWRQTSAALSAAFIAKGFRGDTQVIVDSVRLLRPPGTFNFKNKAAPQRVTLLGNKGIDHDIAALELVLAPYVGMMHTQAPKPYVNGTINGSVNGAGLGPRSQIFNGTIQPGLDAGMEALLPTIRDVALGCPFIFRTIVTGGKDNANALRLQTMNLALFCQNSLKAALVMTKDRATCPPEETHALFDRQQASRRERDLGWPRCSTIASYGAPECITCPHRQLDRSPLNFARGSAQQTAPSGTSSTSQLQAAPAIVTATPIQVGGTFTGTTAASGQIGLAGAAVNVVSAVGLVGSGGGPLPVAALAPLPSIYAYDQLGRICIIETDPAGKQTYNLLTDYIHEKPWLQQTPPSLNFTTTTSQGVTTQIRLPFEVINDSAQFKRTLGRQGMIPHKHELDRLGEFYVAWIDKLRSDRSNVIQNQAFGWASKGGKLEGFVYGGYLWNAGVPRPAANIDPVLASQYLPMGDLQPWVDASKLITNQKRPALDAILASAFAAPLIRFTGQSGVLLSTYSMLSGIGKSTALRVAQAVWGSPIKAVQSLGDTQNSVLRKMGDTKNLPLYWDELKTKEDTQKFSNLAFQLSLGKEKSRLQADTSYRDPGTWQTLLCSTSNESTLAYILTQTKTTAAGLYRVFEYEVPPGAVGQISTSEASNIIAALNENFGQAGLIYAGFLGTQHERCAKEVALYSTELEKHFNVQPDERFWLALFATLMMGAKYANELNLTNIDLSVLLQFLSKTFQGMRQERTMSHVDMKVDANVLGIVARYLNDRRHGYTVVTDTMWRQAGRPSGMMIKLAPNCDTTKIRSTEIHVAENDKVIRMAKGPWDDWLAERGLTPSLINKQLTEQFGATTARMKLGVGTPCTSASEVCVELNYGDASFSGLLDP